MAESQNLIAGLIIKQAFRQKLTGEETLLLKQWCSKSEKNQLVLDQFLDRKWLLENLRAIPVAPAGLMWEEIERNIKRSEADRGARRRTGKRTFVVIGLSVAAVIVLIVVRIWFHEDKNIPAGRSGTAVNERRIVAAENPTTQQLTDGSRILIKKGQYRYDSDQTTSSIAHLEGEALFDMTKNSRLPRTIYTSDSLIIRVLGTLFAVNTLAGENEPSVWVTRGKVKVIRRADSIVLTAGEEAMIKGGRVVVRPIIERFRQELVAWSDSAFHFLNTDMNMAIGEIGKSFGLKVINSGNVMGIPISGDYRRNESLENLLRELERVEEGKAFFHVNAGSIVITRVRQ